MRSARCAWTAGSRAGAPEVALLPGFSTPARLPEPASGAEAWNERVKAMLAPYIARFPQFYDPTVTDTPAEAKEALIVWAAFPASLLRQTSSEQQRWQLADSSRDNQDEYCEWSVERDADGCITGVTFTSEVREYFEHLAEQDDGRLLDLYHQLVSSKVKKDDLFNNGAYNPANKWNTSTDGRIAHLVQGNNNLGAAIDLAANATVLRERDGVPVTDQQVLVDCAKLGNPFRNSDPQIAAAVNNAAGTGAELTLEDPLGLYLKDILTGGMVTPDGADPASFWTIDRGDADHTLRARFEVPAEHNYTVSDIAIAGRPIRFGAQLADRVEVWLRAVVKPAEHKPKRQPCET